MDADRIIVLDEGKIAGIGKHKELMKYCEVYHEIVSSQLVRGGISMSENNKTRRHEQAVVDLTAGEQWEDPLKKLRISKGHFIRLLKYLKPNNLKLIVVFVFAILSTVFGIVGPKIIR